MLVWAQQAIRGWRGKALLVIAAAVAAVGLLWTARYALAINRLQRGVGDTVFYGADGKPWFRMDEMRRDVPLEEISVYLQQAVVATEDHRFLWHQGIDPIAVGRAVVRDLRARGRSEGGSTLTQQLARTLFLSNSKSWGRKAKEAVLALMLEQELNKRQVLELYLNRIYISAGVYGVEPMAQKLFGKRARDLTLAESALIAGLIRAPSALSPWSNLDGAIRRSHTVLARMREERWITPAAEAAARQAVLHIRPYPAAAEARAGYAKEYLRQAFRDEFGGDHPPDWQVKTSFLPDLQDAAEAAIRNGLARRSGELQAALVAIEPGTGNIVALVGGRDYRQSPFNRAVRSRRQPGSAFKPFVYAAALEGGMSPASTLSDLAVVRVGGPEEWAPRNAHGEITNVMSLRAALFESDNRAAASLLQRIGTQPVLELASSAGLRDQPNVPSLALGTGLVSPIELTTAYGMFPNHGVMVAPRPILAVLDADGDEVLAPPVRAKTVLPATVAFQMVSMLQDVVDRGTGAGARNLGVRFPIGGKTGTTDEFKDAWFVGFSSSLVVGVWVGFDQPRPIGPEAYGATVALPIWSEFMRAASRRYVPREFEVPAGIRGEELCRVSFLKPVQQCPTYTEYFKSGDDPPSHLCSIHKGTFKEQTRRVVEGALSSIGKGLKKIFGR